MLSVQGVVAYGIRAIYFLFRMTAGSCLEVENVIKFNGSSKNNKYELGSVLPTGCFHRSPCLFIRYSAARAAVSSVSWSTWRRAKLASALAAIRTSFVVGGATAAAVSVFS